MALVVGVVVESAAGAALVGESLPEVAELSGEVAEVVEVVEVVEVDEVSGATAGVFVGAAGPAVVSGAVVDGLLVAAVVVAFEVVEAAVSEPQALSARISVPAAAIGISRDRPGLPRRPGRR